MRKYYLSLIFVMVAGSAVADKNALAAINAERSAKGRAVLVYDDRLETAAKAHLNDMVSKGFFSHTGSDGSNSSKRLKRVGYKFCFGAENIAKGKNSISGAVNMWMQSGGHRKNILNRKAKAMGIAHGGGDRWVLVLAGPC